MIYLIELERLLNLVLEKIEKIFYNYFALERVQAMCPGSSAG